MAINVTSLIPKIRSAIVSATSATDIARVSEVVNLFDEYYISVQAIGDLPPASENTGRIIYVTSTGKYYFSDGSQWQTDFRSQPVITSSCLFSWGSALLNGTSVNRSSPVCITAASEWRDVSAGRYHSISLDRSGVIWTWGCNYAGQLGTGTTLLRSSPGSVIGGFTDWCQVSAGGAHTAAIRTNGSLWTWGSNYYGRLGDGTVTSRSSPVSVIGGFGDWCQVSAGQGHTAAVRLNGTIWTWGENSSGRLGDGAYTAQSSPVSVVGGFTDWCQVSAGGLHTAAVRSNGSLWTWGANNSGQLGDGTSSARSSPGSIIGGFTDWCQVSTGYLNTVAIRMNGTLWAWGDNISGQLGDGTTIGKSSPVSVAGGFTDWCQVSAGRYSTVAIKTNGTLWMWGDNIVGQLGDGTTASRSSPVAVVGGITSWCAASVGRNAAFGITLLPVKGFDTP